MDRLRLTAIAVLQGLLSIALLVVLVVVLVAAPLVVVWIGLPMLAAALVATRWLADVHRRWAAEVLGRPVPPAYRPLPASGFFARAQAVLADPMTWRDLAWLFVAPVVGLVVGVLAAVLLLGVVTLPAWWYVMPPLMQARSRFDLLLLAYSRTERLEQRVEALTVSRADVVDHSAAELRRLERDLHDGAQARLVALGMQLGLAEAALDEDPERARALLRTARDSAAATLTDIRSVVRGIHPPVLADRGLAGGLEALALDMAVPVAVAVELPERLPAPLETALYFGVAECLANVGRHARASRGWVEVRHRDQHVVALVGDDGVGGAAAPTDVGGTGLRGIARRLSAFDGTLAVSSPPGGPTVVTLEVPWQT